MSSIHFINAKLLYMHFQYFSISNLISYRLTYEFYLTNCLSLRIVKELIGYKLRFYGVGSLPREVNLYTPH
jgi:hypothetical protein